MPSRLTLAVLFLFASLANAQAPNVLAAQVSAAAQDAAKLSPDQAHRTRYLTTYAIAPDELDEFRNAQAFWVNSLSREPELVIPRKVSETLFAVDLADYGWEHATWEKLANSEPYFHQQTLIPEHYGTPDGRGGYTNQFVKYVKKAASAPWCGPAIINLVTLTASEVPIIRADWFISQTGRQADRDPGYYDFLGLGKKEADFQKLIAANVKEAQRVRKEIAAVVGKSIVALNNRSMYRVPSLTGAYWFTQDFKASTDRKNTIRLLDGDLEPPQGDATEQYGTLPNGLFAFFLANDKGERQDSAPDFIAADGKSTDSDRRVHVGISCVRCHAPGIQPIGDAARRIFTEDAILGATDYERLKRLRQLYLSDLDKQIKKDQDAYADVLLSLNGMKPAENASTFARAWNVYLETEVTIEMASSEWGVTANIAKQALREYAKGKILDPILVGLIKEKSVPVRREHFEEVFGIGAGIILARPK